MSEPMAKSEPTSAPAAEAGGASSKDPVSPTPGGAAAAPVRPPRALLVDAGVALFVVAACAFKRNVFLDVSDNCVLALSLLLPGLNLAALGCSLRGYKLGEAALHYRMALGAVLAIYYGYLGLHLLGFYESPLGSVLTSAAGAWPKLAVGLILGALLLQTFFAADACQKTIAALHPAPAPGGTAAAPTAPATQPA